MGSFFVGRPVFASVISIVIALVGAVSYLVLPTARFPQIAPPNIEVSATYTGGSAEEVAKAVATPLEHGINGSPGMIYMSSVSTNDGQVTIDVTFRVGYDLNAAAVDVLTRVNRAIPQLPASVQRQGVNIRRSSRQLLANVALYGEPGHGYDELFLSNYAETQVIPLLRRVSGVGRIHNLSAKRFAIRVWLDPARLEALRISPSAVLAAVQAQNRQFAAGALGASPMPRDGAPILTTQVTAEGRLRTPREFGGIVVRTDPDGSVVRIRDIGRVELGSEVYGVNSSFSGRPSATISIYQEPGANAVQVMDGIRAEMKPIARRFPDGVRYEIASDRTTFVRAAIHEVLVTLAIAIALVVAVTYLFLQSWRATLIPCVAIPVSLAGTFGPMLALGFSLNTLSLLGLVLAVGLVVDDAIVVVENVQRQIEDGHPPPEAARRAMAEVTGPVAATTIVLLALFVPVAFIPGITGQLYNQFALTIAFSVAFSGIVSLTLTPALCALLLRAEAKEEAPERAWVRHLRAPLRWFDRLLGRAARGLAAAVGWLGRHVLPVALVFAALVAVTVFLFLQRPTGFVPDEDQGYFNVTVELPPGASLERTARVVRRVDERVRQAREVASTVAVAGNDTVSGVTAPYYGFVTPTLKPWDKRSASAEAIMARLKHDFDEDPDARIRLVNPPSLPGLGSHGGLTLQIEDRSGGSEERLLRTADDFIRRVRELKEVGSAFPTISGGVPQTRLDVDRVKAEQLGVDVRTLSDDLGIYIGSAFANLFNRFGRTYSVYVQGESSARRTTTDLEGITVPNAQGEPVRVGSLVKARFVTGLTAVTHYNTYPSVEVAVSPSGSSGAALAAISRLADQHLPRDFAIEWSDVAFQQRQAGGFAPLIFALGILLVFLVLATQYESWLLPLVVVLTVPLAVFGAVGALALRGLELDIFAQIGLLMLVGLAAKNSILLVAFARDRRDEGAERIEAARDAARLRLRPILMTSLAFILGSVPLAVAMGAGANARISLGTTVTGGMLMATVLTLFVTPAFYIAADRLRRDAPPEARPQEAPQGAE